jgi:hypothetical protein
MADLEQPRCVEHDGNTFSLRTFSRAVDMQAAKDEAMAAVRSYGGLPLYSDEIEAILDDLIETVCAKGQA